jgi:ADP-heptose:LPS heptosyltransferase
MIVHTDCLYFKGDLPCGPHKESGYHCEGCPVYRKTDLKILIIKLGAIGDVIRTTPLLRKLKENHPDAKIYWLTFTPNILSKEWVNKILEVNVENIEFIKQIEFDWIINLDKDPLAISLTKGLKSKKKSGFIIDEWGNAIPISSKAEEHKWLTGIFDDLNKLNERHYVEEVFDICGFDFKDEEYIIEIPQNKFEWNVDKSKKVIGLNTGCGGRWKSRLWPKEYWVKLAEDLNKENYEVIVLGGEQEHEKNKSISELSGAKYPGYFPLNTFISLLDQCDLIVTSVTMAMHLAIGLKKQMILFNNIFNKNEFYLYGRGEILEPEFNCDCYYTPICENNCMQYIYPKKVLIEINKLVVDQFKH